MTIWSIDRQAGTARAEFGYDWKATALVDTPGTVVPPGTVLREQVSDDLVVPLRPHLGTMGVAPAEPGRHSSVPPGDHGGNVDNWRAGPGTTMYYPVQVPGALLSLGDPHMAQGDAELSAPPWRPRSTPSSVSGCGGTLASRCLSSRRRRTGTSTGSAIRSTRRCRLRPGG